MVYLTMMDNTNPFNPSQTEFLKRCLPDLIHNESLKFRRWQDRQAFLGGRYLLLDGLLKLGLPVELMNVLKYNKYGKPYLPLDIDFNISHSGEFILFAISEVYRIGIDVEKITSIDFDDFRNQFTDLEFLSINRAKSKYTEFFKYWTIKEAVMKADGRGMAMDSKSIVINKNAYADGKVWYLKEIVLLPTYAAHIATDFIIHDDLQCNSIIIPDC